MKKDPFREVKAILKKRLGKEAYKMFYELGKQIAISAWICPTCGQPVIKKGLHK